MDQLIEIRATSSLELLSQESFQALIMEHHSIPLGEVIRYCATADHQDSQTHERVMSAIESRRGITRDVRGAITANCRRWIPKERPAWVAAKIVSFFGERS